MAYSWGSRPMSLSRASAEFGTSFGLEIDYVCVEYFHFQDRRRLAMQRRVIVLEDQSALANGAASEFIGIAQKAVDERGVFTVALSGGSTPKVMYQLLADDDRYNYRIPCDKVHLFWGDERFVPSDDPESNYRMVNEALLSRAPIPTENVHRVKTEIGSAADSAEAYSKELAFVFGDGPSTVPRFDLVMLGMGPDGHTASLFPGSSAVNEAERLVVANWVEKFQTFRITITLPVINNAAEVMFIVGGAEKAEMVKRVLEDGKEGVALPSQLVQPRDGELLWLLDDDA